jgi:hypothetical protein
MAAITSRTEMGKTIIARRQSARAWLLSIPHIFYLSLISALPVASIYGIYNRVHQNQSIPMFVPLCGLLFGANAIWLGRSLFRLLSTRSILTVEGATLHVLIGSAGFMQDYGTYSAAVLTELAVTGGHTSVFPTGRVELKIGNTPLVLADHIWDGDGNHLIDLLCQAYPFATPEPTPSPAVIRW